MVDVDTFVALPEPRSGTDCAPWMVTPADPESRRATIAAAFASSTATTSSARSPTSSVSTSFECCRADEDARAAEREQWNDADNFLAVAPGVVIGYERNTVTNSMLRDNGIEVLTSRAANSAVAGWRPLHEPARSGATAQTADRHGAPDGIPALC